MKKDIPLNEINQYLNNHPRAYVIIGSTFVYLVHDDFACDSFLYNFCKDELQPYIQKYDIDHYKGNITFSIFENTSFLSYKNELLFKRHHDGYNVNPKNPQDLTFAITWIVNELLNSEEIVNGISFNLKEKDLFQQLSDFYRYICLDTNKTSQWLLTNVKELNESIC